MMKPLDAILAQIEKLEAETTARLNIVSKAERDARVDAAMRGGVFPPIDGLDRHQQAAIEAARRAL